MLKGRSLFQHGLRLARSHGRRALVRQFPGQQESLRRLFALPTVRAELLLLPQGFGLRLYLRPVSRLAQIAQSGQRVLCRRLAFRFCWKGRHIPAEACARIGAFHRDMRRRAPLSEESLSIARQWEDTLTISSVLGNLGNVAVAVGEIVSSRALYEESLALKRQLDDQVGVALTLSNLGIVMRRQGDYAAARNCFEESVIIARSLDDRFGMTRAFLNMGSVAVSQDDPVLERTCFEESLRLFRELGDKQGIARSLSNLGTALIDAGEWEAAQACAEESLRRRSCSYSPTRSPKR